MLSRIIYSNKIFYNRNQIRRISFNKNDNKWNKNHCVKNLTSEYHSSQFYVGILFGALIGASCYSLNKYYDYKISKRSRYYYIISGFLGVTMSHLPIMFVIPIYIISSVPLLVICDFMAIEDDSLNNK